VIISQIVHYLDTVGVNFTRSGGGVDNNRSNNQNFI